MRAQASLETLLVLAAMFTLLAVLVPVANRVRSEAEGAVVASRASLALDMLAEVGEEVSVLGSSERLELSLGAESELEVFEHAAEIRIANRTVSRELSFRAEPRQLVLGKGRNVLLLKLRDGAVQVELVTSEATREP